MRRLIVLLIGAIVLIGCSRSYYRLDADKETYGAIRERTNNPQWAIPRIGVEPPPESRMHDPFSPDFPPMPPDDPAAHRYMHCADGRPGYRKWHQYGDAPWIEDPAWKSTLPVDDKNVLNLTSDKSIELAVLDSRDYQTQLETLYEAALALTLNRYDFVLHWFARDPITFTHFGSGADELNSLTTAPEIGFTKAFTAGGQLLVDFTNSFVFQFAGSNTHTFTSNIAINFLQPLLRGFGRDVRMEALTEGERNVLYAVRFFARFRKQFSVSIAYQNFLQILLQVQSIRNQEQNLTSLEQNVRLQDALLAAGQVSTVEADQVLQNFLTGKVNLLTSRAALETQLDNFKITMGLPPTIAIKLDDSILNPFQLNDPGLTQVQDQLEKLLAEYREMVEAPSLDKLRQGYGQLQALHQKTLPFVAQVEDEIKRWQKLPEDASQDKDQRDRKRAAQKALVAQSQDAARDLKELGQTIATEFAALAETKRKDIWDTLQNRIREQSTLTAEVFVVQTQVRVNLINLRPLTYKEGPATQYALANRLDLLNQRGRVVDAWRQIQITANALKGDVNVVFNGNVATFPSNRIFDFRSSASSYSIGLQLEAPLTREAERNAYRTSLISYQQARRSFMLLEDQIEGAIRSDLRQLEVSRLNFEIARQSLVSAARSVEAARDRLLLSENATDTTLTQNVLNALNSLLNAKQTLISNWVNFETLRIQLLLDMEALQVDERGLIIDEPNTPNDQLDPAAAGDRQPNPPGQALPGPPLHEEAERSKR